ncbi:MAG TPA: radical SAM protein [Methanospirillum sp.]|uniref:radical SAM protein n=1 Tax=Methanospirillum sp. TaxID=45200 RepID=UPI002C658516|nr:radical SAM protein [Methanospirillum sp.]HWQ63417.1 radical SAM protein [Methanospirillum sp.]
MSSQQVEYSSPPAGLSPCHDPDWLPGFYTHILSQSITANIRKVVRIVGTDPSLLVTATRLLTAQKKAARRREMLAAEDVQVPAVVMFSLTHQCNLACHGCYMRSLHPVMAPEMSSADIRNLTSQCVDLGVSFLVLAGGEPLVRKVEILMLAREFPSMLFAIFTNGLLIDESLAAEIGKKKNIVPILSIEGDREATDSRRSGGVYDAAIRSFSLLRQNGIFFGCSVTVSSKNFTEVTSDRFVKEMISFGCRLITFVEYVPIEEETSDVTLSDDQHNLLNNILSGFSDLYPALIIGFPGDEEAFGGCLSAGRGFVHISPSGDLEPCPAAPISDVNVTQIPLREALKSDLLAKIRANHHILSESGGGCALWANRGWVQSLLAPGQSNLE